MADQDPSTDRSMLSSPRASVLFLHGADTTPESLADIKGVWHRAWKTYELEEDADLRFSDWRQRAAIQLGPGEITVPIRPRSQLDGPANALRLATGRIAHAITDLGERRRWDVMRALGPQLMGDVLAYSRYRGRIHRIVREELKSIPEDAPVVAVGHSLGGIALVDMLADRPDPRIRVLVTIGSQAPILYVFDALTSIPLGTTKARPFTPWLNVFDTHDFLAFLASSVFPSTLRNVGTILDIEVRSQKPFPQSHSAYWEQREFWRVMRIAIGFARGRYRSLGNEASRVVHARDWDALRMKLTITGFGELADDMGRMLAETETSARRERDINERSMAEHALMSIERGWDPPRKLESGATYWDVLNFKCATVEDALGRDRAVQIVRDYAALKPTDWEQSPYIDRWMCLIVDDIADATLEATELLQSEGVRIFSKKELNSLKYEHGVDVG